MIEKIQIVENELNNQLSEKDDVISQSKTNVEELKVQIEQIQLLNAKEKEESYDIVTKKEEELKVKISDVRIGFDRPFYLYRIFHSNCYKTVSV